MTLVLVVDDTKTDRRYASTLLEERGMRVAFAQDGIEALESIRAESPDLVLTDLQMPNMGGLELVREIRDNYPDLPVILMTAHGSEETAVQALKLGAANYVPKQSLELELERTICDVLSLAHAERVQSEALDCLVESRTAFELASHVSNPDGIVGHLQRAMLQFEICRELDLVRVGTALHEAMVNAREHGNLELNSTLREREDGSYHRLVEQRASEAPFRDRTVHVQAHFTRELATILVRDEGPGFNPATLPDPTSPENLAKASGRGLFLIRTFMDHVSFNERGNEITMIKRRAQ